MSEWSENINAFWTGANNCEFIAWKGSHQIFVYPCEEYPNPPARIIEWHNRIETVEEFEKAIQYGTEKKAKYKNYKEKKLKKRKNNKILRS